MTDYDSNGILQEDCKQWRVTGKPDEVPVLIGRAPALYKTGQDVSRFGFLPDAEWHSREKIGKMQVSSTYIHNGIRVSTTSQDDMSLSSETATLYVPGKQAAYVEVISVLRRE